MLPQPIKEHIMQNHNASSDALERFEAIIAIVSHDDVAVSLLDKLMDSAERYFGKVCEMERGLKIARLRMEGEELRERTEHLDKSRRYAHEALISNLHIFNRYILKEFTGDIPFGGIYSKAPESIRDRVAIADWSGELLTALYMNRKR